MILEVVWCDLVDKLLINLIKNWKITKWSNSYYLVIANNLAYISYFFIHRRLLIGCLIYGILKKYRNVHSTIRGNKITPIFSAYSKNAWPTKQKTKNKSRTALWQSHKVRSMNQPRRTQKSEPRL